MSEFRREIKFWPAYDKRDPDPSKNYGIHGAEMVWYLHGAKGTIQFIVYTNWQLPHVQSEIDARPDGRFPHLFHKPQPADIGYHSFKPIYEGQTVLRESCEVLGGKPCYYDGSSLMAEDVFKILVEHGSDGVWKEMERRYYSTFESRPTGDTGRE